MLKKLADEEYEKQKTPEISKAEEKVKKIQQISKPVPTIKDLSKMSPDEFIDSLPEEIKGELNKLDNKKVDISKEDQKWLNEHFVRQDKIKKPKEEPKKPKEEPKKPKEEPKKPKGRPAKGSKEAKEKMKKVRMGLKKEICDTE